MRRLFSIALSAIAFVVASANGLIAHPGVDAWHPATDEELIKVPILVVGRWNKSPLNRYDKKASAATTGPAFGGNGFRTELIVERVIRGDIKPGTYPLFFHFETAWSTKHGERLFGSHHHRPWNDVEEFADPNLWFLQFAPDLAEGKEPLLELLNDGAVQPLALEPYYAALAAGRLDEEAPKLLADGNPDLAIRVIEYVNGGERPWPYSVYDSTRPHIKPRPQKLTRYAAEIAALIARSQADVRLRAAATYAALAKGEAVPKMRALLADPDANLRAIAAGTLIRFDDQVSADAIAPAVRGMDHFIWACELIKLAEAWKSTYAVPTLIEFLETFGRAIEYGYYEHVPAYHAQSALRALTGCDFPCDVAASRRAWKAASAIDDEKTRNQRLRGELPAHANPFDAKLITDGGHTVVQFTNRSPQVIVIAKNPFGIEYKYRGLMGGGGGCNREPSGPNDFYTLQPGDWVRVKVAAAYGVASVRLMYRYNGAPFGVKGWVGQIAAKADAAR